MDWTTLTGSSSTAGSIANWMNTSQVANVASTIIAEAESFIYRRLRHWKMQPAPLSGSLTTGSDQLALPSDFLEPKMLYLTGTYFAELKLKTDKEVTGSYSYDGNGARVQQTPQIYYFNQSYIQLDSPPDQSYGYALIYYQQPAALSGTNTTNFLTATYPRLMRCACMAAASEFMKDAGVGNYDRTYWDQLALAEIAIAQAESDRAQRSIEVGTIFL